MQFSVLSSIPGQQRVSSSRIDILSAFSPIQTENSFISVSSSCSATATHGLPAVCHGCGYRLSASDQITLSVKAGRVQLHSVPHHSEPHGTCARSVRTVQ